MNKFRVTRKDGLVFYVDAETWKEAWSLARKRIAGSRNRHSMKWKRTAKMIANVEEVTPAMAEEMIANSIPLEQYKKWGEAELKRLGLEL